ncbi:hypothetical protein KBY72_02195 [Cyanobium sp. BA5m-21]|uniref:hypothetical protein n=1 Tax=unclassified Cyanobium TaxID=2627006 RepID=UPI0037BFE3BF|nr:hypothetical protein [Cyanobium sp. BA5m-10]MCP9905992.1 hypothetical protein [Cyanobium sp. BA5m-21]
MIYLQDNPLLREPLQPAHIKSRLLGHWGSSPGQSFIWAHANRANTPTASAIGTSTAYSPRIDR